MSNDELIKQAAKHFSVNERGELSKDSAPYEMTWKATMGVGFDYETNGYKCFNYRKEFKGRTHIVRSHRMIFYLTKGFLPKHIDHVDGNSLNNHPSNLRAATLSQNAMNSTSRKGSSSRFKGVLWHKACRKWRAVIKDNGIQRQIGMFTNELEAASMYNLAAIELHGAFAKLNNVKL
jgi:hypothetical protein